MPSSIKKTNAQSSVQRSLSMQATEAYHRQLMEIIRQELAIIMPGNADTPKLMPFNGYYALGNAPGAFFAVDTNMVVIEELSAPYYDLTLIISLDGKSATRYAFTGTFDGTTLIQNWETSGVAIQLTFTRMGDSFGMVTSCSGSIALPAQSPVSVSGATYNNPIPASLFAGDYYVEGLGVKVMSIGADNQLQYDGGNNRGHLSPVNAYVYNLNMYFFSFLHGGDTVQLIMGTAADKGFACNNMTTGTGAPLVSRSLLTIPYAQSPAFEPYDLSGCQLADFSGYYTIQSATVPLSPLAFVSIQAQYITAMPDTSWDLHFAMISVSLDGIHSQGYYFNPATMTMDGGVLSMPEQGIALKLTREYNPQNGSLVSMSGMIQGIAITGSTLFNPVPLSAFRGVPMTNAQYDQLIINNDNSVTYNGTNMNSILYVPLMYILAYPATDPKVVMSLGTDGTHGNACIVIKDADTSAPKTTSVWAILS